MKDPYQDRQFSEKIGELLYLTYNGSRERNGVKRLDPWFMLKPKMKKIWIETIVLIGQCICIDGMARRQVLQRISSLRLGRIEACSSNGFGFDSPLMWTPT